MKTSALRASVAPYPMPRLQAALPVVLALVLGVACGFVGIGRLQASSHTVSQKGRAFQPGSLVITRGDTVMIVNADSDLLHHAFIEADNFSFDSGDQEPGSRTPVTFTERGTFQVLCGIHPKMKLMVRVN